MVFQRIIPRGLVSGLVLLGEQPEAPSTQSLSWNPGIHCFLAMRSLNQSLGFLEKQKLVRSKCCVDRNLSLTPTSN